VDAFLRAYQMKEFTDSRFRPAELTEIIGADPSYWTQNLLRFLAQKYEDLELEVEEKSKSIAM